MNKEVITSLIILLFAVGGTALISTRYALDQEQIMQQQLIIAEQDVEIAELQNEIEILSIQKSEIETDLAAVRDENEALVGEIEYLQYVLEDPMALFCRDVLELTPEDEELLMQIAMAEAGNQGVIGKMIVMRCVLNRCEINNASVRSIIYAPNQFYTAGMGGWDEECELALLLVASGWDGSKGAVFFCNQGYNDCAAEPLFRYRGHWFSK